MKIKFFLSAALCLSLSVSVAQRDWDAIEIKTEKVTDDIYCIFGSGGNIGLAVGQDFAYLIDDQFAPLSDKILAAVRKVTDKPIRFLVNTHWHGDHVGGNANFAKGGTVIIAHEAVRQRMNSTHDRGGGQMSQASSFEALPKITFTDQMTIHLDSTRTMHIMHVNPSHTDGDSYIYFPESNVIHMGDNFSNGGYPYIDLNSGGDIDGLIKNHNMVLFLLDDDTRIIPGHGPVTNRARLMAYRDMMVTIRTRVKQAKSSGKSLDETLAMGLTAEWDDEFGQGFQDPTEIVSAVYKSLD
jgi:glyoxylase-like metal-dependent hydrolase (beta-lactamase superfamily II)